MKQLYPYRHPEQRHNAGGKRLTWIQWLRKERSRIESKPAQARYPNRYKRRSWQRQARAQIHKRDDGQVALWVE